MIAGLLLAYRIPGRLNFVTELRLFVVGCPRSGTTLLQGILSAHPSVASFPESHFFAKAYPKSRLKRIIGWPALNVRNVMKSFVMEIGRPDLVQLAKVGLFECHYEKSLIAICDALSEEEGKSIWVEKTPMHLHHIAEISRRVERARFIHIIRNGKDVVRSLYSAANLHPVAWRGERSVESCVQRWNHDVLISAAYQRSADHIIVRYEDLIGEPRAECMRICAFLGVEFDERMIQPELAYKRIVRESEKWKKNNALPPSARPDRISTHGSSADQHPAIQKLLDLDDLFERFES